MWTRVRSRDLLSHQRITVFDIEKDLETDKVLKRVREGAARERGTFLFDPDSWKGRDEELKFDEHQLAVDELRDYARVATEVRQKFKERAEVHSEGSKLQSSAGDQQAEQPLSRLRRNYAPSQRQHLAKGLLEGHEHNSGSGKRKRLSLSQVSA